MAKAGLNSNKVISKREKHEGPSKEFGTWDPLLQRKGKPEKCSETHEAVVENTKSFVQDPLFCRLGDADPVEVEALQGKLKETQFVNADVFARELAFTLNVGILAHILVLEIIGADIADRHPSTDGESVIGVEHGVVQLRAQVSANRNERMKDILIAHHPRDEAGKENNCGNDRFADGRTECPLFLCSSQQHPDATDWKKEKNRRVQQSDRAPEKSEQRPPENALRIRFRVILSDAANAQGKNDDSREKKSGEGH